VQQRLVSAAAHSTCNRAASSPHPNTPTCLPPITRPPPTTNHPNAADLQDNDWGVTTYPLIPGHEVVGTVAAKGAAVTELEVGALCRSRAR